MERWKSLGGIAASLFVSWMVGCSSDPSSNPLPEEGPTAQGSTNGGGANDPGTNPTPTPGGSGGAQGQDAASTTDGGGGNADAADAGPRPPLESSLVLWLDPETSLTTDASNHVTAWGDRTGRSTTTLPSPLGAPTLTPNGIGSHKAITGPQPAQSRAATVRATFPVTFGARPVSIFAVGYTGTVQAPALTQQMFYVQATSSVFQLLHYASDDSVKLYSVQLGTLSFTASNTARAVSVGPHVFGVRRKDATVEIRVDGYVTVSTDPNGVVIPLAAAAQFELPVLGEALVYDADLTSADMDAVMAFLKNKYRL